METLFEPSAQSVDVVATALRRRNRREHASLRERTDPVTGLPGRDACIERVASSLSDLECRDGRLAVVMIGIDRLATLHDMVGNTCVEQIVLEMTDRVEAIVGTAMLARTAHDEFALVVEGVDEEIDMIGLCEHILDAIALPVAVLDSQLVITASAGIAYGAEVDDDAQVILGNASAARRLASESGGACVRVFDGSLRTTTWERLLLESELRCALQRGELSVHYQPVVDLWDGSTRSLEALVRWNHPVRGWISPAVFIPLAEDCGLISKLGLYVLEEVTRQMGVWARGGGALANMRVAINVSSRELCERRLVASIQSALMRHGVRADRLCIEITESAIVTDWHVALEAARKIRALGLHLALDDFGTGYSSMVQLKRLPFDVVKIDASFTAGIGDDPRSNAMVDAVIVLAKSLGLCIVPEGVETVAQRDWLRARGCTVGQGFLWSKALSASELEPWMRSRDR